MIEVRIGMTMTDGREFASRLELPSDEYDEDQVKGILEAHWSGIASDVLPCKRKAEAA